MQLGDVRPFVTDGCVVGQGRSIASQKGLTGKMVPSGLRVWFVVHFVVDVVAAVPLLVAPEPTLRWLGWRTIDPFATRLVAVALLGIGIESFLGRNSDAHTYRAMLNLKLIWSGSAVLGISWSMASDGPAAGAFLAIFAAFFAVWAYYRLRLGTEDIGQPAGGPVE